MAAQIKTERAERSRAIVNIRRRLERWELPHLRQLAASQNETIEQLQAELEETKRQLSYAESWAESWRNDALDLMQQQIDADPEHRCIGLTKDGAVMVVDTSHAHQCAPAFPIDFGTHAAFAA